MVSDALVDILCNCHELKSIRFQTSWTSEEGDWRAESHPIRLGRPKQCQLSAIDIETFHNNVMTNATTAVQMLIDPACVLQLSLTGAVDSVYNRLLHNIAQYSNLRALSLAQSHFLTDSHLGLIISCCVNIAHLDVSGCRSLTNASALPIAQGLRNLRSLSIQFSRLGDAVLRALSEHRKDTLEMLH